MNMLSSHPNLCPARWRHFFDLKDFSPILAAGCFPPSEQKITQMPGTALAIYMKHDDLSYLRTCFK